MKNLLISLTLMACSFVVQAQWNTSGTNTLHTNSGNVGIGIDPPLEKLHINGSIRGGSATSGALRISTPTGYVDVGSANTSWMHFRTDRPRFYFDKPITVFGGIGSYDVNDLYFQTHTTTRMTIVNSTGDVGINTTAPQGKFQVNTERPVIIKSNGTNGVYGSEIGFNAVLNTTISPNEFKKLGGTSQYGGASIAVDYTGNMLFQMYNAATLDESIVNYAPQIVFKNDGRIGIGTTNPTTKLTIGQLTGTITSTKGISLGADQNNIEFLHSSFGQGYGAKLYGVDQGNGLTSFRLAVRGNSSTWTDALFVKAGDNGGGGGNLGFVGIGTNNPTQRLTVNGTIYSTEVKVDLAAGTGPDYVFEPTYNLSTLAEIETYIKANKHLPEVPSAKEMETNGINVSEMNMLLLKKVEELTLHLIEQQKEIELLKSKIK